VRDYVLHSFEKKPPPYAILSHTWEEEEVTFEAFSSGNFKQLAGFVKIQYCCTQALADGFEYVVSHISTCASFSQCAGPEHVDTTANSGLIPAASTSLAHRSFPRPSTPCSAGTGLQTYATPIYKT